MPRVGRVLVVDDDADTRELLGAVLSDVGFQVVGASDAAEASARLLELPFDVMVTDVKLGDVDGITLCARTHQEQPDVPVIVITSFGNLEIAVSAMRAGAYDFITKPVEPTVLSLAVRRAFEHRELRREVERSAARVERAAQSFRALIEGTPELVAVLRDGRFVYVNAALLARLGYGEASSLLGRHFVDVVQGDAVQADATGDAPRPRPLTWLCADGRPLPTEAVSVEITFDAEPATAVIARDLSEALAQKARLLETDRLASLGTLAAGMAHEINNPLTYLMLNAEAAERAVAHVAGMVTPTQAARLGNVVAHLANVTSGAERVRQIVRSLRTFSRGEADARTPCDVREVLETAITMVWHEIRPRARFVRELEPVVLVEANEAKLAQVFVNLLMNATQAIPEGHADQHEITVVTGVDVAGRVFVEVRDTGAGIERDAIRHVFDPFFTTKPVGVGTGLGLSICHGIVTSLGGEIGVESRVGEGSTFRLVLPPRVADTADPLGGVVPQVMAGDAPETERARVLVIDDEPAIGEAVVQALSDEFEVKAVTSAHDALRFLRVGERFDALLCDLGMPSMTGMELYEEVARLAPQQASRMIFMTGGAFTERAQEFVASAPTVCIEKPLDLDSLRRVIRSMRRARARTGGPRVSRVDDDETPGPPGAATVAGSAEGRVRAVRLAVQRRRLP